MKQTMVSSGRSVCKVVPLKQEGLEATHGTVSCRARARDTSSNNDHIVLFRHSGILFISFCTLLFLPLRQGCYIRSLQGIQVRFHRHIPQPVQ